MWPTVNLVRFSQIEIKKNRQKNCILRLHSSYTSHFLSYTTVSLHNSRLQSKSVQLTVFVNVFEFLKFLTSEIFLLLGLED